MVYHKTSQATWYITKQVKRHGILDHVKRLGTPGKFDRHGIVFDKSKDIIYLRKMDIAYSRSKDIAYAPREIKRHYILQDKSKYMDIYYKIRQNIWYNTGQYQGHAIIQAVSRDMAYSRHNIHHQS